jgi:uncharacterized protein (TIGR03435 family)
MCVVDQLVAYAYELRSRFQLAGGGASGGPRWLLDEPYEIRALPPPGVSQDQVPAMMRTLLAERFKLKVHWGKARSASLRFGDDPVREAPRARNQAVDA